MLHPSELRCTLLSCASPYGPPIAASLILPTKYTEKTPRNFQKQNGSLQARTRAARGVHLSLHWTKEALIYNIPRPSPHPSHPCKLFGTLKNIMPPFPAPQPRSAHCSFACSICRIIYRKDPAKNHSMGPSVISHWTTEAKKYKVSCYRSCAGTSKDKNDI
jgi:hypothetical protein